MNSILKQVAALPVREIGKGVQQVLLVTSRDTGRWIIPKGWPSKRIDDAAAASREAKQEAGVIGRIAPTPVGSYRYRKIEANGSRLIEVFVYVLSVEKEKKRWPEKVQRQRAWFDIATASRRVREPQLKMIITKLNKNRRTSVLSRRAKIDN
jgi:8-oxo-dGTP pyrophosphatase MutT (NUDIX family)